MRQFMKLRIVVVLLLVPCVEAVLAERARTQSVPPPQLVSVTPPGGQAGTSFEVTVTGQNLGAIEGLYFSVPGAKAELARPMEVASKASKEPVKGKKPSAKGMAPQNNIKFKVTLAENARLGIHDVRVITKGGVSNPRAFAVGDLQERTEAEPNDDVPLSQRVEMDSTVNGVIAAATDVDYFVFAGKKGQRVVISCLSTSIDSKLPAVVEVYGPAGNYLGSGRGYQDNDALVDVTLAANGDHHVRVASFTYTQGGPDYFYRLTISTAPWIDAVYPPVVEPGKTTLVTVFGRNLPGGKPDPDSKVGGKVLDTVTVPVKAPGDPRAPSRLDFTGFVPPKASALDGFELRLRNDAGASNPRLVGFATAPVVVDNGTNDRPDTAQQVALPCEIAGRFEKKGDSDWYVFSAQKGEIYSIEAWADRLGSPVDLFFVLTRRTDAATLASGAKDQVITEQEDVQEVMSPQLLTQTYDPPRYRFVVPADGEYRLQVGRRDGFVDAGPRHVYRVRIVAEKPDFRLVAMPHGQLVPEAAVVGQGGNQVLTVLAWRLDGFNGDIVLTAEDLPAGVTMAPQVLPAGISATSKQTFLVLSAGPDADPWTGSIRIVGTATVGGQKLVREVRSATMTFAVPQLNILAASRLDRSLVLAVRDRAPFNLALGKAQFITTQGGKVSVPVTVTWFSKDAKAALTLTALNLPQGITLKNLTLAPGKDSGEAVLEVQNAAKPGKYTVVLRAQSGIPGKLPLRGPKGQNLIAQPSSPIAITIVPKQLARLSVPDNVKVAAGKETTLPVKVGRLFDYTGPFAVQVIVPAGTKGIQADEAMIGADQNGGSLVLRAAAGAAPGARPNIVVRATAMFHGIAIVHEAKFTVTVVKGK